jgi:hypothetical protein
MLREERIREIPLENLSGERFLRRHKPVQLEKSLDVVVDQNDVVIGVDGVKPDRLPSIHQQNNVRYTAGTQTSGDRQMHTCSNAAFLPLLLESLERNRRIAGFDISAAATLADKQVSL